jgi:hypothetical protein
MADDDQPAVQQHPSSTASEATTDVRPPDGAANPGTSSTAQGDPSVREILDEINLLRAKIDGTVKNNEVQTSQQGANSPVPKQEHPSSSVDAPAPGALSDQIKALSVKLNELSTKLDIPRSRLSDFLSSGFFFTALGLLLLLLAFIGLGVVHTTFSFVLVVLGVAILLYGTGTQGMGRFETDSNSVKYNVALAGGAGVLAFCVAFGIVKYYSDMKQAFGLQTKYVIVVMKPHKDSESTFSNYHSEFNVEGNAVPSMKRGDNVLVYVPFLESQGDKTQRVSYSFIRDPAYPNPSLLDKLKDDVDIDIGQAAASNGGFDFPVLRIDPFDMRSSEAPKANKTTAASTQSAEARQLTPAKGAVAPDPVAPPQLSFQ